MVLHYLMALAVGSRDVRMGGCDAPNIFTVARKLVKCQPCCKRVGHSIFRDLFLVTIVGKSSKRVPQQKVFRYITGRKLHYERYLQAKGVLHSFNF